MVECLCHPWPKRSGTISKMAAIRMAYVCAAGTLPAAGFLLGRVYAEGKKVHPMELDIYDKPILSQEVIMQDQPSDLEVKVAAGRKQVLTYWNSVKDIFEKGQSLAQSANNKASEFMEILSSDQTFQIKVAVISSGVLIGAILAGRGKRRIRRTVYSFGLGTVAASVCYPQKAWVVSQGVYEKTKALFKEIKLLYDEQKKKQTTEIKEDKQSESEFIKEEYLPEPLQPVDSTEEMQSAELSPPEEEKLATIKEVDMPVTPVSNAFNTNDANKSYLSSVPFLGWFFKSKKPVIIEAAPSTESGVIAVDESNEQSQHDQTGGKPDFKIAEDHGQSNPEDKDMYSTRS